MKSVPSDYIAPKGFSIQEILIGVAILIVMGCLSFFVSLNIKKKVAVAQSSEIKVSLAPDAVDPEKGAFQEGFDDSGGIWKYASSAQSEEQFLSEVFSVPEPAVKALATPMYLAQPKSLNKPVFSKEPGVYPKTEFPVQVTIKNPNNDATWTMISVNGSKFSRFENESSLLIKQNDKIQAYVRGDTREWIESEIISGQYTAPLDGARTYRAPVRRIKFGNR